MCYFFFIIRGCGVIFVYFLICVYMDLVLFYIKVVVNEMYVYFRGMVFKKVEIILCLCVYKMRIFVLYLWEI